MKLFETSTLVLWFRMPDPNTRHARIAYPKLPNRVGRPPQRLKPEGFISFNAGLKTCSTPPWDRILKPLHCHCSLRLVVNPLPVVKGNYVQYQQLFKNLLENAIKFSRKDVPPEVCISCEAMKRDEKFFFNLPLNKEYYKIEISDNGIGFNQVNAEKIFEPFVRLHPKSEYEGSGLGLSICKKIADNHDGIIYAEGEENKGSRFTLILPETH